MDSQGKLVDVHLVGQADIVLDDVLSNCRHFAPFAMLSFRAFIITVNLSVFLLAGFTNHLRTTVTAKEFSGKNIIFRCLEFLAVSCILFKLLLNLFKQGFGHDGWNTIVADIAPTIFADVFSVLENVGYASVCEWLFTSCEHSLLLKNLHQPIYSDIGICIHLKDIADDFSFILNDVILVLFRPIAISRDSAVCLSFQYIFLFSTFHLHLHLGYIVFVVSVVHGFEKDSGRSLDIGLRRRKKLHPVLAEDVSIGNRLLPVSGETVRIPDKNNIEAVEVGIRDHSLELRAVVVRRRHRSVNVGVDDVDVIRSGEFLAFAYLTLDRFFFLLVAGISGVDDAA